MTIRTGIVPGMSPMNDADPMHAYYSARAPYMAERLATAPSDQVREIIEALKARAGGRAVLEIACGTGYWTRFVAPVSQSTTAVDFSEEMLAVARAQAIARAHFVRANAYRLEALAGEAFDFGFAMHWVSHIPRARWSEFFTAFHSRLKSAATVLLADDIRRPADTDPFYSKIETRDSYEVRGLPDGGSYEVVKTYFTPDDLRTRLSPFADKIELFFEPPRWWLTYRVKT